MSSLLADAKGWYMKHLLSSFILVVFLLVACMPSVGDRIKIEGNNPFSYAIPYAIYSDLAYKSEEVIKDSVTQGYVLDEYGVISDIDVAYFMLSNAVDKTHLISIRGTANVENTLLDMKAKLIPNRQLKILAHEGFSLGGELIFAKIKDKINPDYQIITTGHSLGGAIAVTLAMYLDLNQHNVKKIVTFGQPKVTDITGSEVFAHLPLQRFALEKDLVPMVPPVDPTTTDIGIYWHLGEEIVFYSDNSYRELAGLKAMSRMKDFLGKVPSKANLKHHRMASYMALVSQSEVLKSELSESEATNSDVK